MLIWGVGWLLHDRCWTVCSKHSYDFNDFRQFLLIYPVLDNLILLVFDLIDDLVLIRLLKNNFVQIGFAVRQIDILRKVAQKVLLKLVAQAVSGEIPLETIG